MTQSRHLTMDGLRPLPRRPHADFLFLLGVAAAASILDWLVRTFPASLPSAAPWDFSWPTFLATALALWWYAWGIAAAPPERHPPRWRQACFVTGVAAIYAVLQTRFQYLSLHMFYLNRLQHVVMHHVGPFLIALGCAGDTLKLGMPPALVSISKNRAIGSVTTALQKPVPAALLFVGTFYLWLIPGLHFRAMIDPRLYWLMNWTMVVDGLFFWCLVLDPRPKPPARATVGMRLMLAIGVMFPQIALGALIAFADRDLYPYYDLCGRLYPTISAIRDQHIGGLIIWILPAMMSALAVLFILGALRRREESTCADRGERSPAILASRWTGR